MPITPFTCRPLAFAAAITAALSLQAVSAYADSGPFTPLAGYWTGKGTIAMKDGTHERIRCRATYAASPSGTALNQSLLCASDSYKFDVKSDVSEQNGAISGNWSETTRNASGLLSGHIDGPVVQANVLGVGFVVGISVVTRGNMQAVSIRPQGGTDVASVTVNLHRQ